MYTIDQFVVPSIQYSRTILTCYFQRGIGVLLCTYWHARYVSRLWCFLKSSGNHGTKQMPVIHKGVYSTWSPIWAAALHRGSTDRSFGGLEQNFTIVLRAEECSYFASEIASSHMIYQEFLDLTDYRYRN